MNAEIVFDDQPTIGWELDEDLLQQLNMTGAAGVRQTSHRSRTAKGEGAAMLFLTLEDLQGTLDAILFPDAYRAAKSLVGTSSPLLVTGVMEMDSERGGPYLRVERVGMVKN